MRKLKKQLFRTIIACGLVISVAVGSTVAYLTDAETATNTFTVGKVKIALSEPNYPGNDSDQAKDLVPNEIVKKDPQVKNVGINDAIIYLKVEVPKADVTLVEDGGARGNKKVQEIFTLKNLKTGDDDTWMEIRKDDSTTDKCVYVFAYKTKLAKDTTTTPLFDEVRLKNVLEGEIDATTQNIKINAYAIQADNILDVDTTTLDKATLGKVYDIYVNQSGNKDNQKSGVATLLDGQALNVRMKTLAGDTSPKYGSTNTTIAAIQYSDTKPSEEVKADTNSLVSTAESEKPVYMWFEDGAIKWWSEAEKVEAGTDLSCLCCAMTSLADISGLSIIDTQNVQNMIGSFAFCPALTNLHGLENWNTKQLINLQEMFYRCIALNDISALSNWNVENIQNMEGLFYNVSDMNSALADLTPLKNWNISNVTNTRNAFRNNTNITDLTPLSNWDVSHVVIMSDMFSGTGITDLTPLSKWKTVNVQQMPGLFMYCPINSLVGLENWDTSHVIDMAALCRSDNKDGGATITDLSPIENWDTSNVTDMRYMFLGCANLQNTSGINNWNILNVTKFDSMFEGCPSHPEFTKRTGAWSNGTFIPKQVSDTRYLILQRCSMARH